MFALTASYWALKCTFKGRHRTKGTPFLVMCCIDLNADWAADHIRISKSHCQSHGLGISPCCQWENLSSPLSSPPSPSAECSFNQKKLHLSDFKFHFLALKQTRRVSYQNIQINLEFSKIVLLKPQLRADSRKSLILTQNVWVRQKLRTARLL